MAGMSFLHRVYVRHMIFTIFLLLVILACRKEKQASTTQVYQPTPYQVSIPDGFPPLPEYPTNPLTVEGVQLGERLFYDTLLSAGGPMRGHACASCHVRSTAMASPAIFNGFSVMPLFNLGWNTRFYLWEGKVAGYLEDVMMFEVSQFFQVNPENINTPEYRELFAKAFGDSVITRQRIAFALAQYVKTLISANSKYDMYQRGEATLTPSEFRGMQIFFSERGDCFHCHPPPLFTDFSLHNIGLDSMPVGEDLGYYLVTGDPKDIGKFRTPTLRNLVYTAPYMHDGRYTTLEQVVNFYSDSVFAVPNLDPIMYHATGIRLNLSPQEKSDLVAFLRTLSDPSFLSPD